VISANATLSEESAPTLATILKPLPVRRFLIRMVLILPVKSAAVASLVTDRPGASTGTTTSAESMRAVMRVRLRIMVPPARRGCRMEIK
jgi:hypothetical protein